ncbi:hypothetical protein MJD09_10270 [bacterium]|nr:hypothetical protein [bacterium]
MQEIGIRMHDITLSLEADNPRLLSYAGQHLHGLVEPPVENPDLKVRAYWKEVPWNPLANPFATNGNMNIIGKRMLGNDDELVWLNTLRMRGLQLRFCGAGGQELSEVAFFFHPKKTKLKEWPEYEYKKYFSLMSYLVYYPIMRHLELKRGWAVLHASALATQDGGILIGGLGGVGKTTTCVALMQHAGVKLISENLVFTDGECVFPCHEPIRLDESSLSLLGPRAQGLRRMVFPEGLKKKWLYNPDTQSLPTRTRAQLLLLPQFSEKRFVREIAPELAVEKLISANRLTRELDDYGWYTAALEMHWPRTGQGRGGLGAISRLLSRVHCFEIGIDRKAGVGAVVKDILNTVEQIC